MEKQNFQNILCIYGDGRNIGKTWLANRIIERFKEKQPVIAIKISPHFHSVSNSLEKIWSNENCHIYKEKSAYIGKDSNRMLKAGAAHVYYAQTTDENLPLIISQLLNKINDSLPIICESAGILNYINPGVSIFIKSLPNGKRNPAPESLVVKANNGNPKFELQKLKFTGGWVYDE